MLVITRKSSESVIIGGNIEIIVSDIGADKVKLCINAPREIPIMRRELLDTRNMNQEAAHKGTPDKQSYEKFKELTKSRAEKTKENTEKTANVEKAVDLDVSL